MTKDQLEEKLKHHQIAWQECEEVGRHRDADWHLKQALRCEEKLAELERTDQ